MIDWQCIIYWSTLSWLDDTFNDWVLVSHDGWSWSCTGRQWLDGVHEFTI